MFLDLVTKDPNSFKIGIVNSEGKWKMMVLIFGSSASDIDGTLVFKQSKWVQIYYKPFKPQAGAPWACRSYIIKYKGENTHK